MVDNLAIIILSLAYPIAIYLIYSSLFPKEKYNKKITLLFYALYYVICVGILINSESSKLFVCINIISFFLLTFLYEAKISHKIFSFLFLYVLLAALEIVSYALFSKNNNISKNTFAGMSFSDVMMQLSYIAVAEIIHIRFKCVNNNIPNNIIFLISILQILLLIIYYLAISVQQESENYYFIISILFLTINFIIFYIFKIMIDLYNEKLNQQALNQYAELLKIYEENTYDSITRLKSLEHDLRNKLIPLEFMSADNSETEKYISKIIGEFTNEFHISETGAMDVDAIINYKYNYCRKNKINFEADISKLNNKINSFDIAVIIGNLLDNAIEATLKISNKRIKFVLKNEKGYVFLMVENTFDGKIKKSKNRFISRKEGEFHGIGLKNVESLVEKYNGFFETKYNNSLFKVSIMLFESEEI